MRTLDPSSVKKLDPYSPEALKRLTLTNLRIRLLKAQTCPAPVNPPAQWTSPTASALATPSTEGPAPYAIYTLQARGTCLCHGHAEHCVPYNSSKETRQDSNMVSGFPFAFQSRRRVSAIKTPSEHVSVMFFAWACVCVLALYKTHVSVQVENVVTDGKLSFQGL